MRIVTVVLGAVFACASVAAAQTSRTTPAACDALRQLQVQGVALNVTKTEWFAANAPLPGGRDQDVDDLCQRDPDIVAAQRGRAGDHAAGAGVQQSGHLLLQRCRRTRRG